MSPYLHQLPSFDSIRSNTKDDLRKINSPGKAKLGVKSHNMNKVIISTQWVHLMDKQNLKGRQRKLVLTDLDGKVKGQTSAIFLVRDVDFRP